jgi:hypothetical protein
MRQIQVNFMIYLDKNEATPRNSQSRQVLFVGGGGRGNE